MGQIRGKSHANTDAVISDTQDLYRFLATPGIEVATLLFAGDYVCWIAWRNADVSHAPMLRHTNDVIASYVTAGENAFVLLSRHSAETRAVHRHGQRYLYSIKRWRCNGENGRLPMRDYVRAKAVRIHIRVREWRAKELYVPNAQYRDMRRMDRV